MSVFMQYSVTVPDPERFVSAVKAFSDRTRGAGARSQRVFRLESDPVRFCLLEEYASHQAAHEASERLGAEFNREAGTEGAEWDTQVWEPVQI